MPIYEYRCKSCDQTFETLRGMRDDSPAACPGCGGAETMRLLSLFAAHTQGQRTVSAPAACDVSAAQGVPCCGGGCGLPFRN